MFNTNQKNCPECKVQWRNDDSITEHFMKAKKDSTHKQHESYKNKTDEEILKVGAMYGCIPGKPQYFGENMMMIEYQGLYDGALLVKCTSCETSWGRFSGIKDIKPEDEVKEKWNL